MTQEFTRTFGPFEVISCIVIMLNREFNGQFRQQAVCSIGFDASRRALVFVTEVPTSCPQFQWAPLQLKGCTQKYFIAPLYHYAIGGVAAHCTCPRRCSRHRSSKGCKELWLPPSPFPAYLLLLFKGSSSVRTLRGRWYMSAAPAGASPWLHALLPGQGLLRFVAVFVRRGSPMDSNGRLRSLRCSLCVLSRSWRSRFSFLQVCHLRSVGEGDFQGPAGGFQWARGTSTKSRRRTACLSWRSRVRCCRNCSSFAYLRAHFNGKEQQRVALGGKEFAV